MKIKKRRMDTWIGRARLVEHKGQHYVLSTIDRPDKRYETMVFKSDATGRKADMHNIYGGTWTTRREAYKFIRNL